MFSTHVDTDTACRIMYPETAPLLDQGWTVDSALDHVQGVCDRMVCTGDHGTSREAMPVADVTLCAWCNAPATRNLDTYHDVACDAHHAQWFAGPDAAPACDCLQCRRVAASRA